MRSVGISFSNPLVRQILAGKKTMTRREAKGAFVSDTGAFVTNGKPPFATGDELWVKEQLRRYVDGGFTYYAADGNSVLVDRKIVRWPWKPSGLPARFCPRVFSRILLRVTDVRVERVQDISDADVAAEGITPDVVREFWQKATRNDRDAAVWPLFGTGADGRDEPDFDEFDPQELWTVAWSLINGAESWKANPWVWVVSFERMR